MKNISTYKKYIQNRLEKLDFYFLLSNEVYLKKFISEGSFKRSEFYFLLHSSLGKPIENNLINMGIAIELLHTSTLIHDDIIDKSNFRRNIKTVHKIFGEDNAILIGNSIKDYALSINSNTKLSILNSISKDINYGQLLETQSREEPFLYIGDTILISSLKAGSFFNGILNIIEEEKNMTIQNETKYLASAYGVLYQAFDDIRDTLNSNLINDKNNNLDKENNIHSFIYAKWTDNRYNDFILDKNISNYRETIKFIIDFLPKNSNILNDKSLNDTSLTNQINITLSFCKNFISYINNNIEIDKEIREILSIYFYKIKDSLILIDGKINDYN